MDWLRVHKSERNFEVWVNKMQTHSTKFSKNYKRSKKRK